MYCTLLTLALKELLALLRDPRSRFVLIGPPIFQLIIFGYAATFDLDRVPVAVYNQDPGAAGRELAARLGGLPHFDIVARIDRDAAIAPLIDNRDALLVLHIGPRFSATIERGGSAPVQAILDGRNSNTAMIALGYLRNILLGFNRAQAAAQGRAPPAWLEVRAWYNENLQSRWFIVPGIVGLLTLIVTALSVVREREQGTFDQLLVTPLRPVEILIGKAIPGLVIGALEASVIIALAVLWFDIPLRGSLGALYLGLFLFLLSAVILSGFATPIANMPDSVQVLTYIDPLRYFLVVVRGVFLEGDGYGLLRDQYWPMALIGLVSLTLAGWLFRHRMY